MPKRDWRIIIEDMLEASDNILEYTADMDKAGFLADKLVKDAVIRNLEILGEAANQIPDKICNRYRHIPWKDIIGLRNIVIHQYFGVDYNIIWSIIVDQLPELRQAFKEIASRKG